MLSAPISLTTGDLERSLAELQLFRPGRQTKFTAPKKEERLRAADLWKTDDTRRLIAATVALNKVRAHAPTRASQPVTAALCRLAENVSVAQCCVDL